MIIVTNNEEVGGRNEVDDSWISFLFECILTFFFIEIPQFDSLGATWSNDSAVEGVDIIDFLGVAPKLHDILNREFFFLEFDVTNE